MSSRPPSPDLPICIADDKDIYVTDGFATRFSSEDEEDAKLDDSTHISFRAVSRIDVVVRNLSIAVHPSLAASVFARRKQPKDEEAIDGREKDKEVTSILDNVSADMPAGQLMAIIGGSGSGKVHFFDRYKMDAWLTDG